MRPDSGPASGGDSFAALVDSNTAASTADNRPQDTSSNQPAPSRRSDDQHPAANSQSQDNPAAPDKAARKDADRSQATGGPRDDTQIDRDAARVQDKPDTAAASKPKSDAATSDDAEVASKPASDDTVSASDPAEIQQDGSSVAIADAALIVATSSPVGVPTDIAVTTTPAADKAAAPLALAAAGIAASAAVIDAVSAPAPDAAGTPTTIGADAEAAATADAAKTTAVKVDTQAAVVQAGGQANSAEATAPVGIALTASVAAATPAAPKTATVLKTSAGTKQGVATPGEQDSKSSTTNPSATAAPETAVLDTTQHAAATGQPKAGNGVVEAVKADTSANPVTVPATVTTHDPSATAIAAQALVNSTDTNMQAGAVQPQLQSISTTPNPTAQLTVTAVTQATVPLSGLAMEIVASAQSGKSRFEIRLDPAELGRIDVRIDVDRNGNVTSHLTVERPETLSMLRQDANQLQRALDNAGLSTGNNGLQFSLRDQSSSGRDGNQPNPGAHHLIVSEEDSVPADIAGRSYGRTLGASGGIDIRV